MFEEHVPGYNLSSSDKMKRKTRQSVKDMNKTLDLYNFEMSGECVKLNFSPDKNDKQEMHFQSYKLKYTPESSVKWAKSEKKSSKLKHYVKSPSFEFFSKKPGKNRKSDSGIFMTPSPVLKDISNSVVKSKSIETTETVRNKKANAQPKEGNFAHTTKEINDISPRKTRGQKMKAKGHQIKSPQKTVPAEAEKCSNRNKTKKTSKSVEKDYKEIVEAKAMKGNKSKVVNRQEQKDDKNQVPLKILRRNEAVLNKTPKKRLNTTSSKKLISSSKLKRNHQTRLCSKNNQSSSKITSSVPKNKLYKSMCQKLVSAPTSTPNAVMKPKQQFLSKILNNSLSSPKVSPVQKFSSLDGCMHGECITSPSDLGSPCLQRVTRQQVKSTSASPVLVLPTYGFTQEQIKAAPVSALPDLSEDFQTARRNIKKQVQAEKCKTINIKTKKNLPVRNISPSKKKNKPDRKRKFQDTDNYSKIRDTEKKTERNSQINLSLNLFEDFLPVKEEKAEKKSCKLPTNKTEINCSILEIGKTYSPNSFSQTTRSFSKTKKGRYSTSRLELWAQQKNEEFEDFDTYELSMD